MKKKKTRKEKIAMGESKGKSKYALKQKRHKKGDYANSPKRIED
jgi:hypothetical protein